MGLGDETSHEPPSASKVEWDDEYELDPYKEKNPFKHAEEPLATHTQMVNKVVIVLLCSQLMDEQLNNAMGAVERRHIFKVKRPIDYGASF